MSAQEFLDKLFGDLSVLIEHEDQLRLVWSDPDNRENFLNQLAESGYDTERLSDIRELVDAPKSDLFDVLSNILFTSRPLTRQDRANGVREFGFEGVEPEMRELLLDILQAYEARGTSELATKKLGQFMAAKYGSVNESKARLGELRDIQHAYKALQKNLYRPGNAPAPKS